MFFSIIVPIYNAEKTIRNCIESILSQDYKDFELILVNDGSIDKSLDICKYYQSKDSRIVCIDKTNGGSTSARKMGVNSAQGEYVICVDSDDVVLPGYLSCANDIIIKYEPDSICFGFREKNKNIEKDRYNPINPGFYSENSFLQIKNNFIYDVNNRDLSNFGTLFYSLWSKVIKKDIFLKSQNMIDDCVIIGEDMLCYALCLNSSNNLYISDKIFYKYELFENSVMHSFNINRIYRINETVKAMIKLNVVDSLKIGVFAYHSIGGEISILTKNCKRYKEFKENCRKMFEIEPLNEYIKKISLKKLGIIDKIKLRLVFKRNYLLLYFLLK